MTGELFAIISFIIDLFKKLPFFKFLLLALLLYSLNTLLLFIKLFMYKNITRAISILIIDFKLTLGILITTKVTDYTHYKIGDINISFAYMYRKLKHNQCIVYFKNHPSKDT
jgi:hypothetical protein